METGHLKTGAVIIGGYVNALDVVRALATYHVPIAIVTSQPYDIAHRSRWATDSASLKKFRQAPDPLLALLLHNGNRWAGRVLIPTVDPGVETLSRHRDELSRFYRVPVLPWSVTSRLLLKNLTQQIAADAGVPQPVLYGPASLDLLNRHPLKFPLLIKPNNSHLFQQRLGRKLIAVHSRDEFRSTHALLEKHALSANAYDYVPGPDTNSFNYITYINRQGRSTAEITLQKIRKSPALFGVGRVVTNCLTKDVAAHLRRPTLAILDIIGWHGPASAEFKLDPRDGKFRLIEINGRCSLMMGIARRAGLNIPYLIWKEATGAIVSPIRPNSWRGVWSHLHADILQALLFHRREQQKFKDYISPYRGQRRTYAVWSPRDPMPFLAQWAYSLSQIPQLPFRSHRRTSLRCQAPQFTPDKLD